MKSPKYSIGDMVYHVTPNSDSGIIVDIIYSYMNSRHTYLIAVGWGGEYVCEEYELTIDKIF